MRTTPQDRMAPHVFDQADGRARGRGAGGRDPARRRAARRLAGLVRRDRHRRSHRDRRVAAHASGARHPSAARRCVFAGCDRRPAQDGPAHAGTPRTLAGRFRVRRSPDVPVEFLGRLSQGGAPVVAGLRWVSAHLRHIQRSSWTYFLGSGRRPGATGNPRPGHHRYDRHALRRRHGVRDAGMACLGHAAAGCRSTGPAPSAGTACNCRNWRGERRLERPAP